MELERLAERSPNGRTVRRAAKPAARRSPDFSPAGLQRRFGNQAAAAMLSQLDASGAAADRRSAPLIQRKLTVGAANDRFEREADAVADRVMRTQGAKPAEAGAASLQTAGGTVQRLCDECEEESPGRSAADRAGKAAASEPVVVRHRADLSQ
jgi:hypothetical protein